MSTPEPTTNGVVLPFTRTTEPANVEVIEGEVVDDSPGALVDKADDGPATSWIERIRSTERLPIIPEYLRTLAEAKATAKWTAKHYSHSAAYHVVRSPLYALKLAVRSPQGALLLAAATGRWLSDAEGRPVRRQMAMNGNAEHYLKLSQQRDARVRLRTILLVLGAAVGAVLLFVLPAVTPEWVIWAGGCIAAGILGKLGTPADRPVASRAVTAVQVQKLTSDVVERALSVLGIAGINQAMAKNNRAIGFTAPISRDGPGWRADVELPPGVTAGDVIERRDRLASGLGRPLGCVWPEGNAAVHPGRLVLWVGDQDMSKAKQPAWPLRRGEPIDLFKPQPFGTDQRGRWVDVTLMFVAGIIGAVPRMGKTFTLRELLLIACLDPRAELHVFDLKGTGDLSPLAPVSHRYRAGDDPEDIEYALTSLRALREEMRRRTKVIRELPKDLCPESKVTSELASKKSLGLHPIMAGVDECQVWFEHPEYGAEIEEICTDLVKRGPATGIALFLATQRPDSKSIPTQISDNAVLRFCLKVAGQVPNDMVLGTSSYKNGVRATTFSFSDKGIGILKGDGDEPRTVRGVYIDAPAAEKIATRARATRVAAGLLTGYAAGLDAQVDERDDTTLLHDVLAAIGDAGKAWSESIVDRLAELRPSAYGPWAELPTGSAKATQLAGALKPYGITTKQVWGTDPTTGKGANRMGINREWIADAITKSS
ncbi:FtsK/SpoIIIE domain-containing protein [Actinokineospora cianjurensis]|uniref:S-DNA-T family DNA segregation ATPase FtsK/SpoIIIE n=1 Tax=Actinokineospora cianjurensis TaxID=585224 RepID=A0A421B611_9PSEU|nr:FtsK/SpoIIIE domain-containing protein [Actinokineospora cianjurensis]RLK59932.1 S-DNA-T family DNA segregation ATPase FtsK/SpoIIIE [Actinokineospora cianjurensis]